MKCPNCEETLVMTERQGIEIDYCPKCRGVWLDKGELDKIIERSSVQAQQDFTQNKEKEKKQYRDDDDDDDNDSFFGNDRRNNNNPNRRRGGFLSNLFDFD